MSNSSSQPKPSLFDVINLEAFENGHPDVQAVEKLLEAGAEVDEKTERGATPLMHAAKWSDSPAIVEALMDGKANLEARNKSGMTPLMYAAQCSKSPSIVEALLNGKANLEATDPSGLTPLVHAAQHSESPAIVEALLNGKANLEARDKDGRCTPLMYAAKYSESPAIVEALLNGKANLEAIDPGSTCTPLMYAQYFSKSPAVVKAFVHATNVKAKWEEFNASGATSPIRQWCRIIAAPDRSLPKSTQLPELTMLLNFFVQRPGLRRHVGGRVIQFYDPLTADCFPVGKSCVVM